MLFNNARPGSKTLLQSMAAMAFMIGASLSQRLAASAPDPLPERLQVDANGVDLTTGRFHMSVTDVSIGQPGAGGLSYTRHYSGSGWRGDAEGSIHRNGSTYTVSLGALSEAFIESGGVYTPVNASGSTLSLSRSDFTYIYTMANGAVATFDPGLGRLQGSLAPNAGILTTFTTPNGEKTTFHYTVDNVSNCALTPCTTWVERRLQSITNNFGYQLHFTYAANATGEVGLNIDWTRLTKVTAINNAVDYCSPTADICTGLTVAWPSVEYTGFPWALDTVTDDLGRAMRYSYMSGGSRLLTGVRWPGSSSDNITIGYHNGRVSSVNRGFGTWNYAYSDSGDTRTTTVTAPGGARQTIVSTISTGLVDSVSDALGRTTRYQYDAEDRVARVTGPEGDYV